MKDEIREVENKREEGTDRIREAGHIRNRGAGRRIKKKKRKMHMDKRDKIEIDCKRQRETA